MSPRSCHSGRTFAAFVGAMLVAVALFAPAASAQTSGASSETNQSAKRSPGEVSNVAEQLSQEIYSPFCPGKTLAMCPSGGAAEVRRDIQEMAREGMSKEEIKDAVIEEYGEEFRFKEPPAEDNYPLLAMIAAGLLICIFAVVWFVRRTDEEDSPEDAPDPDDRENWSDEDEVYLEEIRSQYRD